MKIPPGKASDRPTPLLRKMATFFTSECHAGEIERRLGNYLLDIASEIPMYFERELPRGFLIRKTLSVIVEDRGEEVIEVFDNGDFGVSVRVKDLDSVCGFLAAIKYVDYSPLMVPQEFLDRHLGINGLETPKLDGESGINEKAYKQLINESATTIGNVFEEENKKDTDMGHLVIREIGKMLTDPFNDRFVYEVFVNEERTLLKYCEIGPDGKYEDINSFEIPASYDIQVLEQAIELRRTMDTEKAIGGKNE
jgi:hypothetical protein